MKFRRRGALVACLTGSVLLLGGLTTKVVAFVQGTPAFRESPFLRIDPERIVITDAKGNKPCGECHTPEWEVWKDTKHATGFDTMHKSESAQDIMKAMDLRVTKRQEAICMRCHYTVGPEKKAIAGVSCESCHGPARDWINVHNKWGDGARTAALESPAAREQRVATSRKAGMLRPSTDIYGVTANCFECHTVPVEDLVNRGNHSTGTAGFDLAKRVNTIRHNFLGATKSGGTNRPDPVERTRVIFVVGKILGYEYSLRGLAMATTTGRYANAMNRRVKESARELEDVIRVVPIPQVSELLKAGGKARLVPSNRAELEAAADQVRAIGQRFATSVNGATLAKLDPMMAGERAAAPVAASDAPGAAASGSGGSAASGGSAGAGGGAAAPGARGGVSAAAAGGAPAAKMPELPGSIKARPAWFNAAGRTGMVGAGKCTKCHAEAEDWWYSDPHSSAGKRMFGESARARQIADLYGIGAAGMSRGDKICMSCHGTVDEGSKVVVEDGVSCESCHGAGAGYVEPHQKGGNPQKGMNALKRPADRAQTCSGCHQISDERLLAAGHPSGAKYDFGKGNNTIKHWPGSRPEKARQKRGETYPAAADAALRSAYSAAIAKRPIPNVTVVAPPAPARASASSAGGGGGGGRPAGASASPGGSPGAPGAASSAGQSSLPPELPRRAPSGAMREGVSVPQGALPAPAAQMTTEELLLYVKRRIQELYAAAGRG